MENRLSANIALFLTALIWGLSFVAQRAGMEYVGPFTFNMVRCFLGGLSLLPVIALLKLSAPDTRSERRKQVQHINLERAGIACGIALFAAMSIQQYAMQYVEAGKGGFITALYIVFVPIITILMGEKFSKRILFSVLLSLIGLYMLSYKPSTGFNIYDLLILLSAFFYGVHIIIVNYYSKRVNAIKASCLQFFVVGVLSALLVLLFETPTWDTILACKIPILYAGIFSCGIAYTLQMYGQKYTLPVIASLIFSLESVFAVIGGIFILSEILTIKESFGCLFMISAVLLANIDKRKDF